MNNKIEMLPVRRLHPHPQNPRKDLGDLTELTDSIRVFGIMQNLTVVPQPDSVDKFGEQHWDVIAGHRRRAAAELAGLDEVPCVVVELTPLAQVSVMMTENMQRSELTVEEQGYGFQTMLNLGATFEQIQAQTGVSRKRIKTALTVTSLDRKKLQAASERVGQLSLALLEKLARIEDEKIRNELLDAAGTYNFDWNFRKAFNRQETAKAMPGLKKKLKELGAKKAQGSVYGCDYDRIGRDITISAWKEQENLFPKPQDGLFYKMDEDYDRLEFFRESKQKRAKKSPEEIEKAKRIEETWLELDSLCTNAFRTRMAFIEELTVTKERREVLIRWAMRVAVLRIFSYSRTLAEPAVRALGTPYSHEGPDKPMKALDEKGEKAWPAVVYGAIGDGEDRRPYGGYRGGAFPKFEPNKELERVYAFLEDLGYVKSDVERKLTEGTHELYRRGMR